MSLNASLSIASSGLTATQSQIKTVSNNITNADAAGYTKKTVASESRVVAGQGAGIDAAEVSSAVDKTLLLQRNQAASEAGEAGVVASYTDALQSSLGSLSGDSSLSDSVDGMVTSLDALAIAPKSSSDKAIVVDEAERLANEINQLSDEIQTLRERADNEIAESVEDVNATLHRIDALNAQIADNEAKGRSTADLEDQRAMALESLSREMDITYFTNSKNQVQIYSAGGTPLLDSQVHELEFDAASSVGASVVYDPVGGTGLSGVIVDGKDITAEIGSGEIGGLLTLRDDTLVGRQAEVDELAETLVDAMNQAHNQGTSVPAPASLTGTTQVVGTDAFAGNGTVRIAVVDAQGTVQQTADLDLSLYATYDDLVVAVDAISGLSASIDGQGHVALAADDPQMGLSINEMDSAVGTDAQGLSDHLGLNDLFVVSSGGHVSVRQDISDNPDRLATATLSAAAGLAAGDAGVASGDASTTERLVAALTGDQSFDAAGQLAAQSESISGYAAELTASIARDADNAGANAQSANLIYDNLMAAIAEQSGVNLDEETAELSVLENNYSAMANVIQVIQEMYDSLMAMV